MSSFIKAHSMCCGKKDGLQYIRYVADVDGEPVIISSNGTIMLITHGLSKGDCKDNISKEDFMKKFSGKPFTYNGKISFSRGADINHGITRKIQSLYDDLKKNSLKAYPLINIELSSVVNNILDELGAFTAQKYPSAWSVDGGIVCYSGKKWDLFCGLHAECSFDIKSKPSLEKIVWSALND